jgi:hypothetical protein
MAGNSTIKLQEIVDDAASLGDLSPALATGGLSDAPALSIANDVIAGMVLGGPIGQPFNWKWNRFNVTPFATISLQQDYFVPGVVKLGWLEDAWASNINQTSIPKKKMTLEVKKDLDVTYHQVGNPAKLAWLPNDQLQTGTWGAHPLGPTAANPAGETTVTGSNATGLQNPGANVVYTNPIGALQAPINATTCITDPNGNLWAMTTFGICGSVQPSWPASPQYPTFQTPSTVATTVADGTCVWTAINPKGQGFRLNQIPPQTGIVWLVQPIGQLRAPRFTTLAQTLDPVPDDYATYFKQGFFAECYRRSPDPKVRAKYPQERQLWLEALDRAVRQGDREMDDVGFYPGSGVMDTGYAINPINPAMPYGPWAGW